MDKELIARMEKYYQRELFIEPHVYPIATREGFVEGVVGFEVPKSSAFFYLHIPWCKSKCKYCNLGSVEGKGDVIGYFDEVFSWYDKKIGIYGNVKAERIYIGGGTPSVLDQGEIRMMFDYIDRRIDRNDASVVVEVSPGTIDEEKLIALRGNDVSRISVGVQSFNDILLKYYNRDHDSKKVQHVNDLLRDVSDWEINYDIIVGLPGDDERSFYETLERLAELRPSSVSFLDFHITPGSVCSMGKDKDNLDFPRLIKFKEMYRRFMKEERYEFVRPHYAVLPDEMRERSTRIACLDCRDPSNGFQVGVGYGAVSHIGNVININESPFDVVSNRFRILNEKDIKIMRMARSITDKMRIPEGIDIAELIEWGCAFEDGRLTEVGQLLEYQIINKIKKEIKEVS